LDAILFRIEYEVPPARTCGQAEVEDCLFHVARCLLSTHQEGDNGKKIPHPSGRGCRSEFFVERAASPHLLALLNALKPPWFPKTRLAGLSLWTGRS
jgi:hypothetical protein